ncbi:uncharacterized protein EV420DRAFT_1548912 [Desarmillaria tabescens]|uniref:DUF6534 domain-containing protein n=1 Tax=Armillaria tabescens TaxID=1929756 RepID=A0AA39KCZ5_ARMTA|nr:uncharacterized protein EV420DRAFT_1548912 [Desarmillaria tabescens]KAK0457539.1 hypothetical protein EV420DRAFT_1548912 [Desarmillaria tabescens]
MSSQASPAIPSIGDTFGALFVGAVISAVLYGITNLQVIVYYKRYPNDWSLYRRSVALFWFLDTLHVALCTYGLYYYLIDMYDNLLSALSAPIIWSMRLQIVVKVWIVVFVQVVYAIRLWKLGRHFHKIIPWFVFLAVAASLGSGIYVSYETYMIPNLVSISMINTSIYTFFSLIITADFIIAVMMCYYLRKSRADMHFSSTADLLLGLMQLVLISGLATRSHKDMQYVAWPKTLIFVAIDFILPKLYINSLLAMCILFFFLLPEVYLH